LASTQILSAITPTAILLDVDETILNLPWELIATPEGPLSQRIPFGRLVTTQITPKSGRDQHAFLDAAQPDASAGTLRWPHS
jgi:hypothetical protein